MNLKDLLKEIFDPESIEIKREDDGITATLTGVGEIEYEDFGYLEDDYFIEAWMFSCVDGGKLILHLQEWEVSE